MPRPRVDVYGNVVDPKDLRKLWVIYCSKTPTGIFGNGYLSRDGYWRSLEHAAAWYEGEKALADDAAAQVILSNPGVYFQTVSVIQIEG